VEHCPHTQVLLTGLGGEICDRAAPLRMIPRGAIEGLAIAVGCFHEEATPEALQQIESQPLGARASA
jgi:hypothetical protein